MSTQHDPYAELGVPPNASAAEVHRAFRRRLREHHPDARSQRDEVTDSASDQALQRVLVAYETLRQRQVSHALEPPTEGHHHTPHDQVPSHPSGRPGDPPFTATAVRWLPAAEATPPPASPRETRHRVPKPYLLIRGLLGD